jgi:PAS domain S-box-containing protein
LLRTVIDTIPDYIYVKDAEGLFVLTNIPHAQIMGAPAPEAVVGKTDFEFFPQELASRYIADERAIVQTGQPIINKEEPTVDHQGEPKIVLTTKIPLRNAQNEVVRIVGITHDITERKRAEREIKQLNIDLQKRTRQLEVANKELEAFTYSVSHDLRAPLRAIDGFSRILMTSHHEQLNPEAARYLQRVRGNAQKMGNLIDDLLAFSRLSRQQVEKQRVAIADLVRQVLAEDLRIEQENRQIEITIGDLPACHADPHLLKQVLVNLIGNALKFTQKCEHTQIEIGWQQRDEQNIYFVKDNGAGFNMEYANKLFGVFQRLHSAEDYDGTGVGLAIVQRIIHRHGGRVWAEGETGKGATFYFTLDEDHDQ